MKKVICAIAVFTLLALSACSDSTEPTATPDPEVSMSPEPTETVEPTPTEPPYRNPLSGEGMDEDISGKRPWAIIINNLDRALPQCSVSKAEIIYEIPAEGGVTRMLAIFSEIDGEDPIGSIRSIRPYYADVSLAYNAIIVHSGGSEGSYSEMYSYDMDHLDGVLGSYADKAFYRDPARMYNGYEHSQFTTGDRLIEAAEGEGFSFEHGEGGHSYRLSFSETAAEQCDEENEAEYVFIKFNGYKTTSFTYDEDTELYTAYEYGINYIDGNTEENMTFTNLLVLTTPISVLDDVGRLSVRTTGSGKGYYICGGNYAEIIWERDSNTDAFTYYLADGTKLHFGIGQTYIAIMDNYSATIAFEKQ